MPTALFAGSFDPMHNGHLGVIEVAASAFDQLWVVVATNPGKPRGLLAPGDRSALASAATAHLPNVAVVVHGGLLVDLAAHLGVTALVRSVGKEQATEFEMAYVNGQVTGVSTVFVLPEPDTAWVSSHLVRERIADGDVAALEDLVPGPVALALRELMNPPTFAW